MWVGKKGGRDSRRDGWNLPELNSTYSAYHPYPSTEPTPVHGPSGPNQRPFPSLRPSPQRTSTLSPSPTPSGAPLVLAALLSEPSSLQ